MLILTNLIPKTQAISSLKPVLTLLLTAEERTRTRHRFEVPDEQIIFFRLPRGTIVRDGDFLETENGELIHILAKPESVLKIVTPNYLTLLRVAYHLGNRHVPIEITPEYIYLKPDPVLVEMLSYLGVEIIEEIMPFQPESGAYVQHH